MKRTTYILIGIFFTGLLVLIATFFVLFSFKDHKRAEFAFVGKAVERNIGSFHVVDFTMKLGYEDYLWINAGNENGLIISPSMGGQNVLTYPEDLEKYLSIEMKRDTLRLMIDLSEMIRQDGQSRKQRRWNAVSGLGVNLTADSAFTALRSDVSVMRVYLQAINRDSMFLQTYGVNLDTCNFRSLMVDRAYNLTMSKSNVSNLYLNLNSSIYHPEFSECQIDTEYLIGDSYVDYRLDKKECRRMFWLPQDEDAKLRITLEDKACVLFQE